MKTIVIHFLCLLVLTARSQVKITEMPTYSGEPFGIWMPVFHNGVNKKISGGNLLMPALKRTDTNWVSTRAWNQRGRDSVVRLLSAVRLDNFTTGDGVTDDTKGILAAIEEAKTKGLELVGSPGKIYKFSPTVETDITHIPSFRNITFDMSGVTGDYRKSKRNSIEAVFKITGTKAKLDSNIAIGKGYSQMRLSPGLQISPGDILFITSMEQWVQPIHSNYYKGQRVTVNRYDTSTGVVTIYGSFYENIHRAHIWKNTSIPRFNLDNCNFFTSNNNELICFYFRFANVSIDNSTFKNFGYATIALNSSEGHFEGTQIFNNNTIGNGLSYGIAVWDLSKAFINNAHIEGGRHCITGGGGRTWREYEVGGKGSGDNVVFPPEYYVNGGYFATDSIQGNGVIDAHGNVWMASIKNITAKGGLFLGAVHNIVENVQIESKKQYGISIGYGFEGSSTTIINNVNIVVNDFHNVPFVTEQKLKSLRINNLTILGSLSANTTPVSIADRIDDFQINGFTLNLTNSTTQTNYATFQIWKDVNWQNINTNGISTSIVPKAKGINIMLRECSFNNSPWAYGLLIDGTFFKPATVVYDACTFKENYLSGSLVNTAGSLLVRSSFIRDNGTSKKASTYNRAGIFAAAVDSLDFFLNETSPLNKQTQSYGVVHTEGITHKLIDNRFNGNTALPGYLVTGTSRGMFGNIGDVEIANIIPSSISIGSTTAPAYPLDVKGYINSSTGIAIDGNAKLINNGVYSSTNSFNVFKNDGSLAMLSIANANSAATFTGTVTSSKFILNAAANIFISSGAGSPEGIVTAGVGSMYTRSDGGTGTTLYIKEKGTGNTGWIAK